MKNLNINPLWIAVLTFWIPGLLAKSKIPENPKTILIWLVIAIQIYLLYKGIEILKEQKNK